MKKFDFVSPYENISNIVYDGARKGARRGYIDSCLIGLGVSTALGAAFIGWGMWLQAHEDKTTDDSHDYDLDAK